MTTRKAMACITAFAMLSANMSVCQIITAQNIPAASASQAVDLKIRSAEELISFAKSVNEGETYKDKTVCLDSDIDLTGSSLSKTNWTPAGTDKTYSFQGTFDGMNHKITNMISEDSRCGLFGYCDHATVKNVVIENSSFTGTRAGALAATSDGGVFENCKISDTTVIGGDFGGGAIGEINTEGYASDSANINYISFDGDVQAQLTAGGIVGSIYVNSEAFVKSENCSTTGSIQVKGSSGGFAGVVAAGMYCGLTVVNFNNDSQVKGQCAGGIIGEMCNTKITGSSNTGNIQGSDFAGGIAGRSSGSTMKSSDIIESFNTGIISGNKNVGGIAGVNGSIVDAPMMQKATISNCYNTGEISGPSGSTGGLTGTMTEYGEIKDSWCVNEIAVGSNPEMDFTQKPDDTKITFTVTEVSTTATVTQISKPVTPVSSSDLATETAPSKSETTYNTTVAVTAVPDKTTDPESIIYGDVTGDGIVDICDLTDMSLYLLHDKTFSDKQFKAGDFNCDGKINLAELATLKQFIMKDDIKLGPAK